MFEYTIISWHAFVCVVVVAVADLERPISYY